MDVVLSHITALEILRRWDSFRLIESSSSLPPARLPDRMPDLAALESLVSQSKILSGVTLPIHVLVGSQSGRHFMEDAVAHKAFASYPEGSFLSVSPGIFCATPELVALQMAELATDLELLLLVDELCGHYGIQPYASSGIIKRPVPLTSVARLTEYLELAGPVRGAAKLGRALAVARERSGSPQESRAAHRLEFSPTRGGYGLRVVSLNDPVAVGRSDALLSGVSERIRKPDIMLLAPGDALVAPTPFKAVALDYQGAYHRDAAQEARDINRRNELLASDIKDYEIDREHYDDVDYLDWLVSCIRRDLGIPEPRLRASSIASLRARREALSAKLGAADGLHWTCRERGLVMAGATDFTGRATPLWTSRGRTA